MSAYASSTAPLTGYYRKLGLLVPVPAEASSEAIYQRTMRLLDARA